MEDLALNPMVVMFAMQGFHLVVLGIVWRSLYVRHQAHEEACRPFRDNMIERVTRLEEKVGK